MCSGEVGSRRFPGCLAVAACLQPQQRRQPRLPPVQRRSCAGARATVVPLWPAEDRIAGPRPTKSPLKGRPPLLPHQPPQKKNRQLRGPNRPSPGRGAAPQRAGCGQHGRQLTGNVPATPQQTTTPVTLGQAPPLTHKQEPGVSTHLVQKYSAHGTQSEAPGSGHLLPAP